MGSRRSRIPGPLQASALYAYRLAQTWIMGPYLSVVAMVRDQVSRSMFFVAGFGSETSEASLPPVKARYPFTSACTKPSSCHARF